MKILDDMNIKDICYYIKCKTEYYLEVKWLRDTLQDKGIRIFNVDYNNMYDTIITNYYTNVYECREHAGCIINSQTVPLKIFTKENILINNDILSVLPVNFSFYSKKRRDDIIISIYEYTFEDENNVIHSYIALGDYDYEKLYKIFSI